MSTVTCPKCSARLKVAADLPADARVKCPRCQTAGPMVPLSPPAAQEVPLELEDAPAKPRSRALSKWSRVAPYVVGAFLYLVGVATGWLVTRTTEARDSQAVVSAPAPQPSRAQPDPSPRDRVRPRTEPESTDRPEPKPKPAVDRPPPAQQTLTAAALMKDFLGSNSGSTAAYKGKWLEVSGTVADLRFDAGDVVVVQLDGHNPWRKVVRCTVRPSQAEAAKKLRDGQVVVIRGRCDGHTQPQSGVAGDTTVDVLLGDCYVIRAE